MAGTSTTKTEDGSPKSVEPVDPSTAEAVEQAESTGLVSLTEDNGDQGIVYEANKRETAKIKDEPELDRSKLVEIKIVSPFVEHFVANVEDGDVVTSYTVDTAGVLVPKDVETKIIEQAASQGVAVTAKAASK